MTSDVLFSLVLPWPQRVLWPNSRVHWTVLARAKKQYRSACFWQARQQGAGPLSADCKANAVQFGLHVALVFVPPSRRAFDLDNALASMKSGLDGLADALQVDDKHWSLSIAKAPKGEIGGLIRTTIGLQVQKY